jgi:hypothetical protein
MQQDWFDLFIGLCIGGFGLSASWGLFWLAIGTIGLVRRTCSWNAVIHSLAVLTVPLLLASVLIWARGAMNAPGGAFWIGVLGVPMMLLGFGLRHAPDGQRAGTHMLAGVRHLMNELLGKHHDCGGCGHEHGPYDAGGHG